MFWFSIFVLWWLRAVGRGDLTDINKWHALLSAPYQTHGNQQWWRYGHWKFEDQSDWSQERDCCSTCFVDTVCLLAGLQHALADTVLLDGNVTSKFVDQLFCCIIEFHIQISSCAVQVRFFRWRNNSRANISVRTEFLKKWSKEKGKTCIFLSEMERFYHVNVNIFSHIKKHF